MRHVLSIAVGLALAACGTTEAPEPPATAVGAYKVGKPYKINGRWYYPKVDPSYDRVGTASWYGADFHGLKTANGEVFDMNRISAAHPTLPLPSMVRVTNLENGRSIVLRVNDRGPFAGDRLIDLSRAAARELGYERNGLAKVRVQFVQIADGQQPAPTKASRLPPGPPPQPEPEPVIVAASSPATTAPLPVEVAAREVVPAAPVAAAMPGCAAGSWMVQVGAFADSASLRSVVSEVEALGQVRIEPAFAGATAVARIRLGPLATRDRAGALLGQVQALGHEQAFVTCGARDSGLGFS
jgi:rare lipoprotein A